MWNSAIFANETWAGLMDGLRVILPIVAALLLIYEARAQKLGRRVPARTRNRVAVALTIVGFGAWFNFFNPNTRYPDYYHRAEFFHHFLGAKYSRELGYSRIYECTAVAQSELGGAEELGKRDIRDLQSGRIQGVTGTSVFTDPGQCKQHFTPRAWEAFRRDIQFFSSVCGGRNCYLLDHGFNAPPVWTMEAKPFAILAPAGDGFFKVLCLLDVGLQVAMVLMLFWAFGARTAAIANLFWCCNGAASFFWLGGAFLRQDWLFLLIASLCLARKRMFFLAGAALATAALLRIFPVIFFSGWLVIIARPLIKRLRRRDNSTAEWLHPDHRRLLAGAAVAVVLLVPASVIVTGQSSYPEFVARLAVHDKTPLTDRASFETVLEHSWSTRVRLLRDENLDDPFAAWKQARNDRHHRLVAVHLLVAVVIFGWMAWALRRTKLLWVGLALGAPLVMTVANLNAYYLSFFTVVAVLVAVRRPIGPVALVTASASQMLLLSYYWMDDKFAAQAWLFWIFGLVVLAAYSRPLRLARVRAWWRREAAR